MKKALRSVWSKGSLLVVLALVFGVVSGGVHVALAESAEENLVLNPGFEDGFLHWGTFGSQAQFAVTGNAPHSGEKSLQMMGVQNWNAVVQNIAVKTNTDYRLSFWAKAETSSTGAMAMYSVLDAETDHILGDAFVLKFDGEWHHYTLEFNSGDNDNIYIYLGDGGGNAFYDDFVLVEVDLAAEAESAE